MALVFPPLSAAHTAIAIFNGQSYFLMISSYLPQLFPAIDVVAGESIVTLLITGELMNADCDESDTVGIGANTVNRLTTAGIISFKIKAYVIGLLLKRP